MDPSSTLQLAIDNLLSPPVLGFALGLLAVAIGGDLRLPDAVYQGLSMYLLLAIGLKGGVALRESALNEVALPALGALALGLLIPLAAFGVLRVVTKLGALDRGAIAAHYGSTSLVTFTAALIFLEASAISVEGYVVTLLAILVSHATANAIMAKLSVDWFPHYAVVAWISDVEVAREDRYL
jgi:hypothetical protein